MEKIQVEKEHFCTSVSFSCHNEHAWHKRALEKKEAASSSEYTRVIQTPLKPQRTMMKWQKRNSHSLGKSINSASESNHSQMPTGKTIQGFTKLEN